MVRRFEGKVGVITGGTSGIGRAIAARFVSEGGKIVIGGRNQEALKSIVAELGVDNAAGFYCDVTNREQVDALVAKAYEVFGGFDVMFGNAGVNVFGDFLTFSIEDNRKIFDTNYFGIFNSTQAAAQAFVAHGTPGAIVNTSSINVRLCTPNTTCYAASKGAIAAFTRGVAVELARYGIRANCFAPGVTDTPMVGEIARERFPNYTAKRLAIQRMATPEEQAAAACFLASDDASYMTGEVLFNVGGWGIS